MHSKTLTLCERVCVAGVCVKEQQSTKNTTSSCYLVHAHKFDVRPVRECCGIGPGMDSQIGLFVHQGILHYMDLTNVCAGVFMCCV